MEPPRIFEKILENLMLNNLGKSASGHFLVAYLIFENISVQSN